MKRRLAVLLTVLLLISSLGVPVFAAEVRGSYIGDDITVWICVSKAGSANYESLNGHAWLIIENNTALNYYFGTYQVSPWETLTIGGWSTYSASDPSAGAVYVNRETDFAYSDAVALKYTLDPYSFGILCDAVNANKDKLYYPRDDADEDMEIDDIENAYTCIDFALDVWHAIGGSTLWVSGSPKTAAALWNVINNRTHYTPTLPPQSTYVRI